MENLLIAFLRKDDRWTISIIITKWLIIKITHLSKARLEIFKQEFKNQQKNLLNFISGNLKFTMKIIKLIKTEMNDLNTLTANYEYSRSNMENLLLPIQMQLSEKPKTFSQIFIAFLESTLNFKH